MVDKMNPLAQNLNDDMNPLVLRILSKMGADAYYPELGILKQSAEAKARKVDIDATIGIAKDNDGEPIVLKSVRDGYKNLPKNAYTYASSTGDPELRELWKNIICESNPSIDRSELNPPVITTGLTQALSAVFYLFVDSRWDKVITPDPSWDNYELMGNMISGNDDPLASYPFYEEGKFNVPALEYYLNTDGQKKVAILNFPHNPTGYTPTKKEVDSIVEAIRGSSESGKEVVVIVDDAYAGSVHDKNAYQGSVYSKLLDIPGVVAALCSGPTKYSYVWGGRVGTLTVGGSEIDEKTWKSLEKKIGGYIRATTSSASNTTQKALIEAFKSPSYLKEKKEADAILTDKYNHVVKILGEQSGDYPRILPFNSGYFMCMDMGSTGMSSKIRENLLDKSVGTISMGPWVRTNYTSVKNDDLPALYERIGQAWNESKAY